VNVYACVGLNVSITSSMFHTHSLYTVNFTDKVIHRVTTHHWAFKLDWKLMVRVIV
jgi:hypothetical protein